jgi:hypothetical protein
MTSRPSDKRCPTAMIGIKERNLAPLSHEISLEELAPKNNFYRHFERTLELSFVRETVRPLYAKGGMPSMVLEVFFKLHLVLFFEEFKVHEVRFAILWAVIWHGVVIGGLPNCNSVFS